jgi:hypothetical protein
MLMGIGDDPLASAAAEQRRTPSTRAVGGQPAWVQVLLKPTAKPTIRPTAA